MAEFSAEGSIGNSTGKIGSIGGAAKVPDNYADEAVDLLIVAAGWGIRRVGLTVGCTLFPPLGGVIAVAGTASLVFDLGTRAYKKFKTL